MVERSAVNRLVVGSSPTAGAIFTLSMNTHYIEEASKVITNKQQLVNMVSKRLRELSAGSRPMIEVDLQMGLADIALAEIAAGKLSSEFTSDTETLQAA